MSAIVVMYAVDRSHLPALRAGGDGSTEPGPRVGRDYGWSGYCMLYVLEYLREQGLTLAAAGEYDVLTRAELASVDPAGHDLQALSAYLSEELGDDEAQDWAGPAALESLQLLHEQLGRLTGDDVLLLRIC
jgi:hypothetical protein